MLQSAFTGIQKPGLYPSPLPNIFQKKIEILNMDLKALVEGTVRCKKAKPPKTQQIRKEAFKNYMNLMYDFPTIKKVPDLLDCLQ